MNCGQIDCPACRPKLESGSFYAARRPLATLKIVMGKPSSSSASYRGRLAPSPTGYLHVGHARTFWTAFERARAAGGVLAMRMEDLDPDRSREIYAAAALEDLRWLGIRWQEGPGSAGGDAGEAPVDGPYAPYAQSGRRAFYLEAWRRLLRGGFLYPCRCSRRDLEAALSAPHENSLAGAHTLQKDGAEGSAESGTEGPGVEAPGIETMAPLDDEPVYPGTCRPGSAVASWSEEILASGIVEPGNFNWRFRVPDGETVAFEDGNLGPQRFVAGRDFGDFVVWRRDGVPSYQLACVADDAAMKITEVVRGEDLLKSTARQILLYRALELESPAWFHCRLVVDGNGLRLAKRHDALSLRVLRERGVTPDQILSAGLISPVSESRPGVPGDLQHSHRFTRGE